MKQSPAVRKRLLMGLLLGVGLMLPAVVWSQSTTNVDVNSEGEGANNFSFHPAISANGRYVAFHSWATNLVVGDNNEIQDIFVYDRQTGTMERVSVNTQGGDPNGKSENPCLSANGRFVAFSSNASNLVPDDNNGDWDAFVYDRQTGTTERVSVNQEGGDPNHSSSAGCTNADGRFVAFSSLATNLVPDDNNDVNDIFVYDRHTGTTERVNVSTQGGEANLHSQNPSLSADGRFVVFESSATNLVENDNNRFLDIFVYDRQTGTMERVSVNTQGGDPNRHSEGASLSADGRFVAFHSSATDLVKGDDNGNFDIFIYDRQAKTTERVNVDRDLGEPNEGSVNGFLSGNGRFVVFESGSLGRLPTLGEPPPFVQDIYVHDRKTKTTKQVNVNNLGETANGDSVFPSISDDGRVVTFRSFATNLIEDDGLTQVGNIFVRDRANPDRADVDGDEIADIVWRNQVTGATAIWLMEPQDPHPSFPRTFPREMTFPGGAGLEWQIRGVGDVTDDGHADLVWYNTENGATAVWLMNEKGLMETATFPGGAGLDWSVQGVGDVNNDGLADFVWRNIENGATAVWLMDQEGEQKAATFPGGADLAWSIRGVADVNRDGTADWVWRNNSTGAAAVWLMNEAGLRQAATFPGGAGNEWKIEGVDDFNGDGHADLVWSNPDTRDTAVWLMNAAGLREEALSLGNIGNFVIEQVGDFTGGGRADRVLRGPENFTFLWVTIRDEEGLKHGTFAMPRAPPEWEVQP